MTVPIHQVVIPNPRTNRLLARLAPEDYAAVMLEAKIVHLKYRKRLYRQDEPVDAIFFPMTCVISLLVTGHDRPLMELATIGREGVLGAAELIQQQGAIGLSIIQIPGTAVRINADAFGKLLTNRPMLQKYVDKHLYALMRQIMFGAACNRIHSMEERCARWLLMTHDHAGADTFPLTQEFLSHMLGVRRATVNVATGLLKKAGFIRYVRGKVTVTDRRGLESATCDCYQAIIMAHESLFPGTPMCPLCADSASKAKSL